MKPQEKFEELGNCQPPSPPGGRGLGHGSGECGRGIDGRDADPTQKDRN